MIRTARYILAAAGSAAILAGGMALAGTGAASAGTLPTCNAATQVNCTNSMTQGTAGYYGADDNHTHYRFVQTVTIASPHLVNLNGTNPVTGGHTGAVGVNLCDPNTGDTAQISLGWTGTAYEVRYAVGRYFTDFADPCVQVAFAHIDFFKSGTLLMENPIAKNDQIYLAIYYTPSGRHFHQLSFGVCDITAKVCRQAYSSVTSQSFWEFGIGAFTQRQHLTGGAINPVDSFSDNAVTCYACSHSVPITEVAPVNPFGIGGLYEAQFLNLSSQVTLTPDDSLSASTAAFDLMSGSTSS